VPIFKGVKAKIDYSKMSHKAFAVFVRSVYKNLLGSPYFPNPPILLAVLLAKLEEYEALITAAMDRSRTAILERNSAREELAKMLTQIAHYVEAASDDDPQIFATSGLQRLPTQHIPPQPLEPVRIRKIAHAANSGAVDITLPPTLRKVKRFEVRVGLQDSDTPPTSWRIEMFTSANGPVTIRDLEPGKRYAFQMRAIGALGFTDWSDSVLFICT